MLAKVQNIVVDVLAGLPAEASGRISCVFHASVNPDPEVDSLGAVRTGKTGHCFHEQLLWRFAVAGEGDFGGIDAIFWNPPHGVESRFFVVLDGQQLLAIEGSFANLS